MAFDPLKILEVLQHHHVNVIVVGGMAAALHGSDMVTFDLDVTPERRRENLERLSTALVHLHARIRIEGDHTGVAFKPTVDFLSQLIVLNLTTDFGDLDLVMSPAGLSGYDAMSEAARRVEIDGVSVQVASLDDVITSKEASNRAKDRLTLPGLRMLRRKNSEGG